MHTIIKSSERGHLNFGWLDTYHSFSFGEYYNPERMGFSVLRVINEDRIEGGSGFPTHGHKDMEIITYIVSGALEHQDSMGNKAIIKPGEVQRMTAGTGVKHSEFNHLKDESTHLLQIWILPNKTDHAPGYGQQSYLSRIDDQKMVLVASPEGDEGTVSLNQDVKLYVGKTKAGFEKQFALASGRCLWVQVINGYVRVNSVQLNPGDGFGLEDESQAAIVASPNSEFLLFDLPRNMQ